MRNVRFAAWAAAVLLGLAAMAGVPAWAGAVISTAALDFTLAFPKFDGLSVTHIENFTEVFQKPPNIATVPGTWSFGQNAAGTGLVYELKGMQETVKAIDLAEPVEFRNGVTAYLDMTLVNNSSVRRVVTFTASWKPSLSVVGQDVSIEDEPRPFGTSVVQIEAGTFADKTLIILADRRIALGDGPLTDAGSKSFDIAVAADGGTVTVPLRIVAFAMAGARVPEPSSLGLIIACLLAAAVPAVAARRGCGTVASPARQA